MLTTIVDWIEAHEGILTALATIVIAVFTWALARSTKRLWIETKEASTIAKKSADAALKTAQNMEAAERAYVKMSHLLPGVRFEQDGTICRVTVQMRIKNYGRTPAKVTNILFFHQWLPQGEPLPRTPDYPQSVGDEAPKMFLVTDEEVFTPQHTQSVTFTVEDVRNGVKHLWLYGYVDYIDQFGQRHRSGYASAYNSQFDLTAEGRTDVDNLVFVTQEGYNYDRPRKRGEGNDWDEPPN
jgi:hypothetical protein